MHVHVCDVRERERGEGGRERENKDKCTYTVHG